MSYFFPGLWHFAAAMAFSVGFGEISAKLHGTTFSYRPEFLLACLFGSSALFFIPDALAKKGLMKFLHYPLPDWDVLLLGPASHRHWLTHSPFVPLVIFGLSWRHASANPALPDTLWQQIAANAACGFAVGLSSHLFWDGVSSRSAKIVFVPYWWALRPSVSRIYLLSGAAISLLLAFAFASYSAPSESATAYSKSPKPTLSSVISSTRSTYLRLAARLTPFNWLDAKYRETEGTSALQMPKGQERFNARDK